MKKVKSKDFIDIKNAVYIEFHRYKTHVRDNEFILTERPMNFNSQMFLSTIQAFLLACIVYGLLFFFAPAGSQNFKFYSFIVIFIFMENVGIVTFFIESKKRFQYKTILFFDKSTDEATFWDNTLKINISTIAEIHVITSNSLKMHDFEQSASSYPSQQLQLKLIDGKLINIFIAKFDAYNTLKLGKKLSSFFNIPITHIRGLTYSEAL